MTFEAFIIEMIFFIEMAGSRYARPRRLRLSLTKPLRRRGRLQSKDHFLFIINQARYKAPNLGITLQYQKYTKVFLEKKANTLPLDKAVYKIQLLNRKLLLYSPLFTILQLKLEALYKYLNKILKKRQIRELSSLVVVLVLFIKKLDRGLYLYINYQRLVTIIKN